MKLFLQLLFATLVLGACESVPQKAATPAAQGSSPGSGVPAVQEVDATGEGATEDEAFRQAVVDAVRQVVGTLVSAENVVSNERVIKDEVLTLSNGFVEKVLNQDKTKLDDGTWQVKLKCIVRRGQVYSKLQQARVPTVKVDGASLFADVASQIREQKDAAKLLAEALATFSPQLVTAKVLDQKPPILQRNESQTIIELNCQAVCNLQEFFGSVAPKCDRTLSALCSRQSSKEVTDSNAKTTTLGISGGKVLSFEPFIENDYRGGQPVIFGKDKDPSYLLRGLAEDCFTIGLPIRGASNQKKWSYKFYAVDKRVFSDMPETGMSKLYNARYGGNQGEQSMARLIHMTVVATFMDANGTVLSESSVGQVPFGRIAGCDISLLPLLAPFGGWGQPSVPICEWKAQVTIATEKLGSVASIKLVVR
jgi:hypothetical protein